MPKQGRYKPKFPALPVEFPRGRFMTETGTRARPAICGVLSTDREPVPVLKPLRTRIALNPAAGDWLYYVLDAEAGDGSHVFTADYDEFVAAKQRCNEAGLGCG